MLDEIEYQGHKGLYALSVDLEKIIRRIEKRRKKGHAADKKIISRLRELNLNLKLLSKEWSHGEGKTHQNADRQKIVRSILKKLED
jgi:hypothetical protein